MSGKNGLARLQAVTEITRYLTPLLLGVAIAILSGVSSTVDAIRDKQSAFGERIRALEVAAGIEAPVVLKKK